MLLYKDVLSGDEMLSDSYDIVARAHALRTACSDARMHAHSVLTRFAAVSFFFRARRSRRSSWRLPASGL
jgi:hypothetical protein